MTGAALLALATAVAPAPRAMVFDGAAGRQLLGQCSRETPAADAIWRPNSAQVARAEAAVAVAYLHTHRVGAAAIANLTDLQRRWRVEATGYIRYGRRGLYLNFVPRHGFSPATGYPTIICDGGPALFGAAYDLATGRVTALAFNGAL